MSKSRGRFQRKKLSKTDEALKIARANKKKLATAVEVSSGADIHQTTLFNATPIVTYMIPVGTGNKTRLTSARVKGTIKRNNNSVLGDDWRVDLVLDREPNGFAVTPLQVYADATPEIGQYKNTFYKKRFKILRTAMGVMGKANYGVSGVVLDWYVKLNLIAESTVEDSFIQANVIKNSVYLIYWTTAVANHPQPIFKLRLSCMD